MKGVQFPKGIAIYIVGDLLASLFTWISFFLLRKLIIEYNQGFEWDFINDPNFFKGLFLIPLGWLFVYGIFDSYRGIYRMSRMSEAIRGFFATGTGCLLLFFMIILDDLNNYSGHYGYKGYYVAFFGLFFLQYGLILLSRMTILTLASRRIKSGKVSFKTLIIGSNTKVKDLYNDIKNRKVAIGYDFIGFLNSGKEEHVLTKDLPCLGTLDELGEVLDKIEVEEVVLALDLAEGKHIRSIINELSGRRVLIKVLPDLYDILLGSVQMNHVYGAVLIEIKTRFMPIWFKILKRTIDLTSSIGFMLVFAPLYLFIAIKVRLSSKGPIFYKQERIGKNGKPFMIYKFRSMYLDAEKGGPQLSSDKDDRCTPWGKIMRKYRLDELPQFWNVIKGDMSLVGPRPERQFFIDQIAKRAPHVIQLQKVRPGITSWGQVKYGYASNVDEMVQRLRFDILYIENISLSLDIKIIFYTVLVILKGSGK